MRTSEYRRHAKKCLQNKTLRAFRIPLLAAVVGILSGLASFMLRQYPVGVLQKLPYQCLAQSTLLVGTVGVLGSLRQGGQAWLLRAAGRKEPSGVQIVYWMRRGRGLRAAALFTRILLRKLFWCVFYLAPSAVIFYILLRAEEYGVDTKTMRIVLLTTGCVSFVCAAAALLVTIQKYALAPILLARSPHDKTGDVLQSSMEMMEGHTAKLLLLKLSFLPYVFLCAAVIPIAVFLPLYRQSVVCFLRDVLRDQAKASADAPAQ
ncbi:MAG: DUF975 family protein [Clostridia bacterium]|nr:DUF975 family protein [Clostridia bacterium]